MFARIVFDTVENFFLPVDNNGWKTLPDNVFLPCYKTQGKTEVLCSFLNEINAGICKYLNALSNKNIDKLCMYCNKYVECFSNNDDSEDKKLTFEKDNENIIVGWDGGYVNLLQKTTELPILAIMPELKDRLNGSDFEVQKITDLGDMSFSKERIIKNLNILSSCTLDQIKNYPSTKAFLKSNNINIKDYHAKCKELIAKIEKMEDIAIDK